MRRYRHVVASLLFAAVLGVLVFAVSPVRAIRSHSDDLSEYYKAKCSECHGDKAELKFDQNLPEADMVKVILKGKLVDDPPDMPAFEQKGVTTDKAKALAGFMKKLRKTAGATEQTGATKSVELSSESRQLAEPHATAYCTNFIATRK